MTAKEKHKKSWLVYVLRCYDGSLYTGVTTDILRRIKEHSTCKGSRCLRGRLPVKLVYQESRRNRSSALKREAEIKKFSRSEKLILISVKQRL